MNYATYSFIAVDVADLAGPWCFELLPVVVVVVAVGIVVTGGNGGCVDWLDCTPFALDFRGDCKIFKDPWKGAVHNMRSTLKVHPCTVYVYPTHNMPTQEMYVY